jgi:oxygen-dependent protoporphyrinogen oxidase
MFSDDQIRHIVIVGGGIAGLTAAYRLGQARRQGAPIDEVLVEAGDRVGGVIRTDRVDDCLIEAGPDSFLREKPETAALARELGLGEQLMGSNDATRRTYILHKGRLEPFPEGLMLVVPTRVWPVLTTPLIPLASKVTMAREWVLKRAPGGPAPAGDESVQNFITRHFGDGMLENITEPLLAGVYGGDPAALSAHSVLARFRRMEEEYGSLTRGALALRKKMAKTGLASQGSIFVTLRGGLGSMIESLAAEIGSKRIELARRLVRLEARLGREGHDEGGSGRYRLSFADGSVREADSVVLGLPAWASADLLAGVDRELACNLAKIPYNSALTVALGYGGNARSRLPGGFGFLVPRVEQRSLLACTFMHAKFDHRAPANRALLRCFLGGSRHPGILEASNDEILRVVRGELHSILGLADEPVFGRIYRWPRAMAQYTVGHGERLRAIAGRLREHPGLYLAGNAFAGIGISDVIRTGETAARAILADVAPAAAEKVGAR